MKTYTYHIYQEHICTVKDTYEVRAESKKEADRIIVQAYKTGDEDNIEHIDRDQDIILETLEPTETKANIDDEYAHEIDF